MSHTKYRRYYLTTASHDGPFYAKDGSVVDRGLAKSFGDECAAKEFALKHDKIPKGARVVSGLFTEEQLRNFERGSAIYARLVESQDDLKNPPP